MLYVWLIVVNICLVDDVWDCHTGAGGTAIGNVYRLTFEECKENFFGSKSDFMYYRGNSHCQEIQDYTLGNTDGNNDWQSCTQKSITITK